MGNYLQRDLSGMEVWQRMGALSLDLMAWALLLAAVVYGWRFLGSLHESVSFSELSAHQFMRCAQLAIACLALLMFALIYAWALDIAEENKRFV